MSLQQKPLPKGWIWVKLADITHYVQRGRSYKYDNTGTLPIINQRCIRWSGIDFRHVKYTNLEDVNIAARRALQRGDILWNSTGVGTLGRAAIFQPVQQYESIVVDSHVTVIRVNSSVLPSFLYNFISSPLVQSRLPDLQTGSTGQVELNLSTILNLDVPLPPVREQRRITDALTTIKERVNQIVLDVEQASSLLERYFARLLEDSVTGKLIDGLTLGSEEHNPTNASSDGKNLRTKSTEAAGADGRTARAAHALFNKPDDWSLMNLGDLTPPDRPIRYGILQPGPNKAEGVPYVRVVDIKESSIDLGSLRRTTSAIAEKYRRAELKSGDVLLSIRGTVGKIAQVPPVLNGANITQDTVRISLSEGISARFIFWYLHSAPAQSYMKDNLKGIAVRGINVGDVRAMLVPVPPLTEQYEIARRLDCAAEWVSRVGGELASTLKVATRMMQAASIRAMKGGLVTQNADDREAADELAAAKAALGVELTSETLSLEPVMN